MAPLSPTFLLKLATLSHRLTHRALTMMRSSSNVLALLAAHKILLVLALCIAMPVAAVAQAVEAENAEVSQHGLAIKFVGETMPSVLPGASGGLATSGVRSVDQLHVQHQVVSMERIFRPAGKHASRHAEWGLDRWYRVEFAPGAEVNVHDASDAYSSDPNIEIASLDYTKELHGTLLGPATQQARRSYLENVTQEALRQHTKNNLFAEQWHFENTGQTGGTTGADINLLEAHRLQTGSSEVVVQVIDSGIQVDHPDLADALWVNPCEEEDGTDTCGNGFVDDIHGYNFADDTASVSPPVLENESSSHGTHVSGIIAARNNNEQGIRSVAGGDGSRRSGVRIMTGVTFGERIGGFAEAIVYGADNGAVISNNSWGYRTPGVVEPVILDAIDYFVANAGYQEHSPIRGGLFIASAGNANSGAEFYPAAHPAAISVGATDHDDQKASYSNFGSWVDIAAPGGERTSQPIISTVHERHGTYGGPSWAGTSMAAPSVAGVAALIASAEPRLQAEQIRDRLTSTAVITDASDKVGPRLDAYRGLIGHAHERPPPISELSVNPTDTAAPGASVELSWSGVTAPDSVDISHYKVRYSKVGPIDEQAWRSATEIPVSIDHRSSGEEHSLTAEGLPFDSEIWFAVRTIDSAGQFSTVSRSPSIITPGAPRLITASNRVEKRIATGDTLQYSMDLKNSGATALHVFSSTETIASPLSNSETADSLLSITPTETMLAPGAADSLTLQLDTSTLSAGAYRFHLHLITNDPESGQITIPVNVDVVNRLAVFTEDMLVHPNERFILPVQVESLTDEEVFSYEFTAQFEADKLKFTGVNVDGTLSEQAGMAVSQNSPGEVSVAALNFENHASSSDAPALFRFSGEGTLLKLEFEAKEVLGEASLDFLEFTFNDGQGMSPAATQRMGSILIVPLLGDVALNLAISSFDAALVLQQMVGLVSLSETQQAAADVSGAGFVSARDASLIQQHVVGLLSDFPASQAQQSSDSAASEDETVATVTFGEYRFSYENPDMRLPLRVETAEGAVHALHLDASLEGWRASPESVSFSVPDQWLTAYNLTDDRLQLAMAGPTPLPDGTAATIELQTETSRNGTIDASATINELAPQTIREELRGRPEDYVLHANYPNPVRYETTIAYELPEEAHVHLEIFDMLGRAVHVLVDQKQPPGRFSATWDGRSTSGAPASSGVYMYRLTAGDFSDTQSLTIIR